MTTPNRITCPHCGESFDPLTAAAGADLGQLMAVLAGFGKHAALARDYIRLFRKDPQSTQRVSTQLKLARELAGFWRAERFKLGNVEYRVTRAEIVKALAEVVRLKAVACGFANHNYLKTVLLKPAREQGRQEARAEARAERKKRDISREASGPERLGGEGDQRHITEQPLEHQAVALASVYRTGILAGMPWVGQLEQNLREAGADLELLGRIARKTEDASKFNEMNLLARVTGQSQTTPVGQCLPDLGGMK